MDELIKRLSRYSEKAVADALDADFAKAVKDAMIELNVQYAQFVLLCNCVDTLKKLNSESSKDLKDCRNELCLRCGEYRTRHLGSCDGCRWKDGG